MPEFRCNHCYSVSLTKYAKEVHESSCPSTNIYILFVLFYFILSLLLLENLNEYEITFKIGNNLFVVALSRSEITKVYKCICNESFDDLKRLRYHASRNCRGSSPAAPPSTVVPTHLPQTSNHSPSLPPPSTVNTS